MQAPRTLRIFGISGSFRVPRGSGPGPRRRDCRAPGRPLRFSSAGEVLPLLAALKSLICWLRSMVTVTAFGPGPVPRPAPATSRPWRLRRRSSRIRATTDPVRSARRVRAACRRRCGETGIGAGASAGAASRRWRSRSRRCFPRTRGRRRSARRRPAWPAARPGPGHLRGRGTPGR